MAELAKVSPEKPEERLITYAAQLIQRGQVVAIPTDTIYGLAADPFNLAAVTRIYDIKGRPEQKALPILVGSVEQAEELAFKPPRAFFVLAQRFWPGPLTLVVQADSPLPLKVTGNTGRVALRMPDARIALELIERLGGPVTGTSANISGFPACNDAGQVVKQLGDRLPLVLDGGKSEALLPSTVVDLRGERCRLLREGPISEAEIVETLGG